MILERICSLPKEILLKCLVPFLNGDFWCRIIIQILEIKPKRVCDKRYFMQKAWKTYYMTWQELSHDNRLLTFRLNHDRIRDDIYDICTQYLITDDLCKNEYLRKRMMRSDWILYCRLVLFYRDDFYWDAESVFSKILLKLEEKDIILINDTLYICALEYEGSLRCSITSVLEGTCGLCTNQIYPDRAIRFSVRMVANLRGNFKDWVIAEFGKKILALFLGEDCIEGLELLGYKWEDNKLIYKAFEK